MILVTGCQLLAVRPNICTIRGVEVWTHKIKGLTESDSIFAAKVDAAMVRFLEAGP